MPCINYQPSLTEFILRYIMLHLKQTTKYTGHNVLLPLQKYKRHLISFSSVASVNGIMSDTRNCATDQWTVVCLETRTSTNRTKMNQVRDDLQ
jgi:hypothetical protein